MRNLIVLALLCFGMTPAHCADQPTEEEIRQKTAECLEHSDTDADGVISLKEQQERLETFYVAFAKVGKHEDRRKALRAEYPGLLCLQEYLAADLNDDSEVTEKELKRLYACEDPQELWTLCDADIDLLVQDFILRIRKGAKVYYDDSLRKTPGKGRTKAEKLADQAAPYKDAVTWRVLGARVDAAQTALYSQDELSSMFDKEGRSWTYCVYHAGSDTSGTGFVTEVVAKDKAQGPREAANSIDGGKVLYPEGYRVPVDDSMKGYGDKPEVTKVRYKVAAGEFDCDYIEITCLRNTVKLWVMSKHPGILVKRESGAGAEKRTVELMSYKD
ncbi:MAG: hypothetical protein KDB90_04385 [Planctomycetes bacterium]|nr:hypothetical protein [Planctomycetota bacterium]